MVILEWLRLIFRGAPEIGPKPTNQSLYIPATPNPFPGRWQGSNEFGIYSEVIFSSDGKFSAIMQSAAGGMQKSGTFQVIDEKTILFVFDLQPHEQTLQRGFGQVVTRPIYDFPQETNYYEFLNAQTLVMRASAPPYPATTYHKIA
jgi:hypothetical protein